MAARGFNGALAEPIELLAVGQAGQRVRDRLPRQLAVRPAQAHYPEQVAGQDQHEHSDHLQQQAIVDRRLHPYRHVAIDDGVDLVRGERGDGLIEDVAQHRLRAQHADAEQVVQFRHLAGDLQVEPALVLDGVGGHHQRAQGELGLALVDQAQGLRLAADDHELQAGVEAAQLFLDRGTRGQGDAGADEVAQAGDAGVLLAADQHIGVGEVGLGEQQPGVAVRALVEKAQQLALASLGGGQRGIPVRRDVDTQRQPGAAGQQAQQIGGDAFMLAAGIEALERRPVRVDTHTDFGVGAHIGLLLR